MTLRFWNFGCTPIRLQHHQKQMRLPLNCLNRAGNSMTAVVNSVFTSFFVLLHLFSICCYFSLFVNKVARRAPTSLDNSGRNLYFSLHLISLRGNNICLQSWYLVQPVWKACQLCNFFSSRNNAIYGVLKYTNKAKLSISLICFFTIFFVTVIYVHVPFDQLQLVYWWMIALESIYAILEQI